MTIGKISYKYKVNESTLRFYEKIGILGPIRKDISGIRDYSSEDEKRVLFICEMKKDGLSLNAIKDYLSVSNEEGSYLKRVSILSSEKDLLDKKIEEMIEMRNRLLKRISSSKEFLSKKNLYCGKELSI